MKTEFEIALDKLREEVEPYYHRLDTENLYCNEVITAWLLFNELQEIKERLDRLLKEAESK